MERFYTCKQIADRYGVNTTTVWDWIRKNKLRAVRIGRLYRVCGEDLMLFEKQNTNRVREGDLKRFDERNTPEE